MDIQFADDITQLVKYPGKSREMLARKTEREIKNINQYEQDWKIQTNRNKFKILMASRLKGGNITIDNEIIEYSNKINILGLQISRTGIGLHIKERIGRAREAFNKIKRFGDLTVNIKLHLYKALIRSIIEYPMVPMCTMSRTNMLKVQSFQNKCLKYITATDHQNANLTNEEIHIKYQIDPFNIRLWKSGQKVWRKLEVHNPELTRQSMELNEENTRDHYWWNRIGKYVANSEPQPIYGRTE